MDRMSHRSFQVVETVQHIPAAAASAASTAATAAGTAATFVGEKLSAAGQWVRDRKTNVHIPFD